MRFLSSSHVFEATPWNWPFTRQSHTTLTRPHAEGSAEQVSAPRIRQSVGYVLRPLPPRMNRSTRHTTLHRARVSELSDPHSMFRPDLGVERLILHPCQTLLNELPTPPWNRPLTHHLKDSNPTPNLARHHEPCSCLLSFSTHCELWLPWFVPMACSERNAIETRNMEA